MFESSSSLFTSLFWVLGTRGRSPCPRGLVGETPRVARFSVLLRLLVNSYSKPQVRADEWTTFYV